MRHSLGLCRVSSTCSCIERGSYCHLQWSVLVLPTTAMSVVLLALVALLLWVVHQVFIAPRWNPLQQLAGPPSPGLFKNHLFAVLEYARSHPLAVLLTNAFCRPSISPRVHETFVQRYGRSIRIRGVGPVCSFTTLIVVSISQTLNLSGMNGSSHSTRFLWHTS